MTPAYGGGMPPDPLGTVEAVHAFPVKSLRAGPLATIELDAAGVAGDRRFAVVDRDGVLTADAAPRLRDVVAAIGPDGAPLVRVPGTGGVGVGGAQADAALSGFLGRPVRLAPVPAGSTLDAPVHLVSRQALDAAARGEHDAAHCACSLEEPRANLVLDLPGLREEQLVGRRLTVGTAVLRIVRRPNHCLGVYAEVEQPGCVGPGDVLQEEPDA